MTTCKTTRRAVLAGAAALPALAIIPATAPPAGLVALTGFLREQTAAFGEFYFDTTSDEPAAFASSLDDAVRGMAGLKPWGGVADAQAVDPVFAVIKHSERL